MHYDGCCGISCRSRPNLLLARQCIAMNVVANLVRTGRILLLARQCVTISPKESNEVSMPHGRRKHGIGNVGGYAAPRQHDGRSGEVQGSG